MGSLTSRPELPQAQQPVIITMPSVPLPSPSPQGGEGRGEGGMESEGQESSSNSSQAMREENLLQRSRGALSTVLTGFSGILSQTVAPSARKTLLGE